MGIGLAAKPCRGAARGGFMEAGYNVAIVGLGRVGTFFLERLLKHANEGIRISAVVEMRDTPGKLRAQEEGIPVYTLGDLSDHSENLDLIFELTGSLNVRAQLKSDLALAGNTRTIVVPETVAHFISCLLGEGCLPDVHPDKGF